MRYCAGALLESWSGDQRMQISFGARLFRLGLRVRCRQPLMAVTAGRKDVPHAPLLDVVIVAQNFPISLQVLAYNREARWTSAGTAIRG